MRFGVGKKADARTVSESLAEMTTSGGRNKCGRTAVLTVDAAYEAVSVYCQMLSLTLQDVCWSPLLTSTDEAT